MKRKDIPIDELLLDAENPRHGDVEDQGAALERLVAVRPQHLRNLAEDIAENGLHPGLGFLVFPTEDGHFVVLDGNRRLAAVKLLTQPEYAPRSWRPLTTEIKVDLASFEKLPCTILASREEGKPWLERMHTGQRDGTGVVQWPPIAQHRFSPRNDQRGRGAAALAWLSSRTAADATELHEAIEKVEDEITTFGRLVQNRDVRPILGYNFKGSELVPTSGTTEETLYSRLIQAVQALAGDKDVNDLRTREQCISYAHELAGTESVESPAEAQEEQPSSRGAQGAVAIQPTAVAQGGGSETTAVPTSPATPASRRSTRSAPARSVLQSPLPEVFHSRIVQISSELCDLNVHKTPNAVAVLLRLLIEMSTEQCRQALSLPRGNDLNERIKSVIQAVQTGQDQKNNVFHGIMVSLQSPTDPNHTKNFNQYVHNVDYHPVPMDLISIAKNYLLYLERVGQRLVKSAAS